MSLVLLTCVVKANDRYIEQGVPSSDRIWEVGDYEAFQKRLEEGRFALPRLTDPDGAKIVHRISAVENFAFAQNESIPITNRIIGLGDLIVVTKKIVAPYLSAADAGSERSLILGFLVRASGLLTELMHEGATLVSANGQPSDIADTLQGLKRINADLFSEAFLGIATGISYNDSQRSHLLEALADASPQLCLAVSEDAKPEIIKNFRWLRDQQTAVKNLDNIDRILKDLGGYDAPVLTGATLTEFGIYEKKPTGEAKTMKLTLVKQTDAVTAVLGTTFGFRYTVNGTPENRRVDLEIRLEVFDPKLGKIVMTRSMPYRANVGALRIVSFNFDYEKELVPGDWTLSVYSGSDLLVKKMFYVVLP